MRFETTLNLALLPDPDIMYIFSFFLCMTNPLCKGFAKKFT